MNVRFRVAETSRPIRSSSFSSFSSSNPDIVSTALFFPDRSLSLGRLIGIQPNSLCELPSLGILQLNQTEISGRIPKCLGNVLSLREIYLSSNRLNSSLPSSLWNLKNLLTLNLSSNSFTGSIPKEVKNLEAAIAIDLNP
ncbi:unnamed protein product [Fraxinus pennsylvanica]|uniref:Uncharacterized protein n=1 Tax=Fraxinus pennsylvanica TaxID=56036 RepID=A0AAD1ZSQ1_9LAMI|nr:unnamed protein product [Fraxinus pennsylvanica]